jgi:hypothetical protein
MRNAENWRRAADGLGIGQAKKSRDAAVCAGARPEEGQEAISSPRLYPAIKGCLVNLHWGLLEGLRGREAHLPPLVLLQVRS